jgi:hypothetical protein
MKLIILRLNTVNKPSPMSEGVAEIRINNQSCKGINLTTRHTQTRRAPRVATIHDVTKKSGRVLPRPSAVFHAYALADTPWVARTLSHYISVKRGKLSSNSSTHELLSLGISYVPYAPVHFNCCSTGLNRRGLNRHRCGLPPWSSEYQIRSFILLPIQYSLFSPNCPARSPVIPTIRSSC